MKSLKFLQRIKTKEITIFYRQLAILFEANIPPLDALKVLGEQTRNPLFKSLIFNVEKDIRAGEPLSQAMAKHPKVFSDFYINVVKAGEATGKLHEVLKYLADHAEREYNLNHKIRGAFTYPAFIFGLFMIVAVWLIARDHIELGWAFAALALVTKQTALLFLPALIVLSLKNRRFRSTVFGMMTFSLTFLLVWSPLLFSGYSLDFAFQNSGLGLLLPGGALSLSPEIPGTSIDAFNIWPLITWVKDGIPLKQGIAPSPTIPSLDDTLPNQMFGMSCYQFGLLLFLVFYVPILLMIWKASDSSEVMMKFGLLMLAFFILPTRIHERYLIFSIAFLPLALATSRVVSVFYVVLATTFSLNLLYGFSTHVNPFGIPNQLDFMQSIFSDGFILLIIIVNVAVFLLFFSYCVRHDLTKKANVLKRRNQHGAR